MLRHPPVQVLVVAHLLLALPALAVNIEWVSVGNPGNHGIGPADATGSVGYAYSIAKYEVTNAQYAEFLNAVADNDSNALYNEEMSTDARGGILRSGSSGSYSYAVKSGHANNPVVFVSFYDTLRFANWLHNGQPSGLQDATTTEFGAYDMSAGGVTREAGARYFLPTDSEWYKAAYYNAALGAYYVNPGTDDDPIAEPPPGGPSSANFYGGPQFNGYFALTGSGAFDPSFNYLTDVGSYTAADTHYGTFDQGGNVREWNEQVASTGRHYVRGGSWAEIGNALSRSSTEHYPATLENFYTGFRLATIPEPTTGLLTAIGLVVLAVRQRRRVRTC
jgi:formylglycine-generating enzyme